MNEANSKYWLKEESSNIFLLIFTISLVSFLIFKNSRLEAFFITFFITLVVITITLYISFRKIEKEKIKNIETDRTIRTLKCHNYQFALPQREQEKQALIILTEDLKHTKINVSTKATTADNLTPLGPLAYRIHTTNYKSWNFGIIISSENTLPSVLKEFGQILNTDNGIESHFYSDNQVNELILKMNICLQQVQNHYSSNLFSKEMTISLLKATIDYLMEKDKVPNYGNYDPYVTNLK